MNKGQHAVYSAGELIGTGLFCCNLKFPNITSSFNVCFEPLIKWLAVSCYFDIYDGDV